MAKKSKKTKKKIKKTFWEDFDIWNLLLLIAIGLSIWYIYDIDGISGIKMQIASSILYAGVISLFVRFIIRKARK